LGGVKLREINFGRRVFFLFF